MKKARTVFICQNCGSHSPKWLGRCPACGEWDTLIEEKEERSPQGQTLDFTPSQPVLYQDIEDQHNQRESTGLQETDRVLGGGLVAGSLVLIGGEPGIGKSTLLLQVSRELAERQKRVLYVSGEESLEQIKIRGKRLGVGDGDLYILAETNLEQILEQTEKLQPELIILDSVQTIFSSGLSSSPGTISQVREVTNQIFRFAKTRHVPVFLVGHITKEGSLAGPKALEHMVDVVLYFEGERDHSHRILRALKNRFGPVSELAIFEMSGAGLEPIPNPSAFFLKERPLDEPGSVAVCTIKGSRPLLAEIQSLVSSTLFVGNARRMSIGLDQYRVAMLLAVVEKKLGLSFGGQDVHLNVAGGLSISEPAADLGVMAAVVSCIKNRAMPKDMTVMGEVGLSGEIRSVSQPAARIKESAALGFKSMVLPEGNLSGLKKERGFDSIKLIGVKHIKQVLDYIF
jgi:DNA repair protein RadA/Sms